MKKFVTLLLVNAALLAGLAACTLNLDLTYTGTGDSTLVITNNESSFTYSYLYVKLDDGVNASWGSDYLVSPNPTSLTSGKAAAVRANAGTYAIKLQQSSTGSGTTTFWYKRNVVLTSGATTTVTTSSFLSTTYP